MKTIVFQSFRDYDVPKWVDECLESVGQWTLSKNYTYKLFGDEFFDFVPIWARDKIENANSLTEDRFRKPRTQQILLLSDLARLRAAEYFITTGGYDRAIWCDADMTIFRPEFLGVENVRDFAFCEEWWIDRHGGGFTYATQVNNSICLFDKGNKFLPFYIDACERIFREAAHLSPLTIGTIFLTVMKGIMPLPLIKRSGILSPALMQMVVEGDAPKILQTYKQMSGQPMAAANLCMSFRNKAPNGMTLTDDVYATLVRELRKAAQKGDDLVSEKAAASELVPA